MTIEEAIRKFELAIERQREKLARAEDMRQRAERNAVRAEENRRYARTRIGSLQGEIKLLARARDAAKDLP
jgi:hypothetical protein